MPDSVDILKCSELALQIGQEAGALALKGFRSAPELQFKGRSDLLTAFDVQTEQLIRARLGAAMPNIPIRGEEEGSSNEEGDAPYSWLVDPIDGTTNFAHGHPFWCVSIGLVDNQGQPVAGAVVAPPLNLEWVTALGQPTTRNGRACQVTGTPTLEASLLATGFPYDKHESADNNLPEFAHLLRRVRGVRRCGAAALDLCFVADGTYDGYWENKLGPWDVAAGAILVANAGGRVSDRNGEALRCPLRSPGRSVSVIASGPELHPILQAALASARGTNTAD